jgi:stage V sporulation protein G
MKRYNDTGYWDIYPRKQSLLFGARIEAMQITDIKIRKLFSEGPMKAVVSVTFDGQLAVHDIKVINAGGKLFIVMPTKKNPDGSFRDVTHPITAEFRRFLGDAVLDAYREALEQAEAEAGSADVAGEARFSAR